MKIVKMFIMSLLVFVLPITATNANNCNKVDPGTNEELRTSILSYLTNAERIITEEARSANIKFFVNGDNEVIVLSVDTEFSDIKRFINVNLNNVKIAIDGINHKETYTLKVTFQDEYSHTKKKDKRNI